MGVYDIGDDPASEDDMDDNGMNRYMEKEGENFVGSREGEVVLLYRRRV